MNTLLALVLLAQLQQFETVTHCRPADLDSGTLTGRVESKPIEYWPRPKPLGTAEVESVVLTGTHDHRFDIVFLGDGFTASELPDYANAVDAAIDTIFSISPFDAYEPYFNVHRVDVVSNDSGVDHDPTFPIWRDTALNGGYWCDGDQYDLCFEGYAIYDYYPLAPGFDSVIVLTNSSMYGGLAFGGIAAATGAFSPLTDQTILHELGHSIGELKDEYTTGAPFLYVGPEPNVRNITKHPLDTMLSLNTKWSAWVDEPAVPMLLDGPINSYEGAIYGQTGVFRPSPNSLMRSLGQPHHAVAVEAIIIAINQSVPKINDSAPSGPYGPSQLLWVEPMQPLTHSLDVQWSVDWVDIPGETNSWLVPATLDLPPGEHFFVATVTDNTPLVRDEVARTIYMTQSAGWWIVYEPEWSESSAPAQGILFESAVE